MHVSSGRCKFGFCDWVKPDHRSSEWRVKAGTIAEWLTHACFTFISGMEIGLACLPLHWNWWRDLISPSLWKTVNSSSLHVNTHNHHTHTSLTHLEDFPSFIFRDNLKCCDPFHPLPPTPLLYFTFSGNAKHDKLRMRIFLIGIQTTIKTKGSNPSPLKLPKHFFALSSNLIALC